MKKNVIDFSYREKEITIESQIQMLKNLWKILGIKGTPTREDIENPTTIELEISKAIRKFS